MSQANLLVLWSWIYYSDSCFRFSIGINLGKTKWCKLTVKEADDGGRVWVEQSQRRERCTLHFELFAWGLSFPLGPHFTFRLLSPSERPSALNWLQAAERRWAWATSRAWCSDAVLRMRASRPCCCCCCYCGASERAAPSVCPIQLDVLHSSTNNED